MASLLLPGVPFALHPILPPSAHSTTSPENKQATKDKEINSQHLRTASFNEEAAAISLQQAATHMFDYNRLSHSTLPSARAQGKREGKKRHLNTEQKYSFPDTSSPKVLPLSRLKEPQCSISCRRAQALNSSMCTSLGYAFFSSFFSASESEPQRALSD